MGTEQIGAVDEVYMGDLIESFKMLANTVYENAKTVLEAPVKVTKAGVSAVENVASGIGSTAKLLPVVLIILALGIGAYLVFRGKSEKGGLI
jgi:ABC-type protease/lipase transport system fused ATPase/permease subunit